MASPRYYAICYRPERALDTRELQEPSPHAERIKAEPCDESARRLRPVAFQGQVVIERGCARQGGVERKRNVGKVGEATPPPGPPAAATTKPPKEPWADFYTRVRKGELGQAHLSRQQREELKQEWHAMSKDEQAGFRQRTSSSALDGVWTCSVAGRDVAGIIEGNLLQWHKTGTVSAIALQSPVALALVIEPNDPRFDKSAVGAWSAELGLDGRLLWNDGESWRRLCGPEEINDFVAEVQAEADELYAAHADGGGKLDGVVYCSALQRLPGSDHFPKYEDGAIADDPKLFWPYWEKRRR